MVSRTGQMGPRKLSTRSQLVFRKLCKVPVASQKANKKQTFSGTIKTIRDLLTNYTSTFAFNRLLQHFLFQTYIPLLPSVETKIMFGFFANERRGSSGFTFMALIFFLY